VDQKKEQNMLAGVGLAEILIVALVVLLVFGVGRITKIAGELGSGVHAFRKGLKGELDEEQKDKNEE
jgi:sec-independent protein translocase protein TatA